MSSESADLTTLGEHSIRSNENGRQTILDYLGILFCTNMTTLLSVSEDDVLFLAGKTEVCLTLSPAAGNEACPRGERLVVN